MILSYWKLRGVKDMYILKKKNFLFVCFAILNEHNYAMEEFDAKKNLGKESGFKVIEIEIKKPTYKYGAGICATDGKESVILFPSPNQIELEVLIEVHGSNSEQYFKINQIRKTNKLMVKKPNSLREVPAHVDYLMCNSLNDYGNLVLRAYIDATQRLSARQSEFHQLYQGFYDLITSNEEGKIILKDIIDPVSRNIQTMRVLETDHSDAVPGLVKSLAIVPSLIEKSSVVPDNNASTSIAQSLSRSFPVHYLAHPIATGSLSFMIVGGIGYITTDPRSALVYATVGGIAAYILPQLYNYHAKYEAYSF